MKRQSIFNDLFGDLIQIGNELQSRLADSYKGEHNVKYTYKNLDQKDKKDVITKHLSHWADIAKNSKDSTYVITFNFGDDEEFYFTWDADEKKFITKDPNGDEFYYNTDEKMLEKIVKADDKKEQVDVNGKASGVREEVVDNTAEPAAEDDGDGYYPNYNLGDIKADKNLAFNLRNELNKWKEQNPDDEEENCDDCDKTFCPYMACDTFKEEVIDPGCFDADFDDEGNVVQISFPLREFFTDETDEDFVGILQEVYHNESDSLDKFCELVKEEYGFSLGSWNVDFLDENRETVGNIEFIFTF